MSSPISFKKFILVLLGLIAFLPFFFLISLPEKKLNFIACDVGQGDAFLLSQGLTQVLIDGGPDSRVLTCLAQNIPFYDKKIEMVVNTHPEKDHLGGLIEVLDYYQVDLLVTNSLWQESEIFRQFWQKVVEKKIKVYSPQKGDLLKIGNLIFRILWPPQKIGNPQIWDKNFLAQQPKETIYKSSVLGESVIKGEVNDISIVLLFSYQNFDILFTGDISSNIESLLLKENQFQDVEVLKVAHHGSKYSTSKDFLEAVKPKLAIISVGKNPWGHPTKEVLERLAQKGIKILRTDKDKIKIEW